MEIIIKLKKKSARFNDINIARKTKPLNQSTRKNMNIAIQKSLLSPPGDTIQETIEYMGMSQAELAERVGRPKEKINDIIKGREPISNETAYALERVLKIPSNFWINREKEYRIKLYEIEQQEVLEEQYSWSSKFPLTKMRKLSWIPNTRDKQKIVSELLSFFGVASKQEWDRIYIAEQVSVAFRISLANTKSPHAISAWLRKGEVEAMNLNVKEYNKQQFKDALLGTIKNLVHQFPTDFSQKLQAICAECGVVLTYVPTLPKAPISGASRWFHGKPLIQLSGRYRTDDHFWFTFYHEAAHILLHGKKDIFLEKVAGTPIDQEKESEADAFASKHLLKKIELDTIIKAAPLSFNDIKKFAKKFNTSSGVIVGRLQHLKLIEWSEGNELRQKVNLFPE